MGKAGSPGQSFRSKPRWALGAGVCGKGAGAARKRLKRKRIAARRHWVVEDFRTGNAANDERPRGSTRGFTMGDAAPCTSPHPGCFVQRVRNRLKTRELSF